MTKGQFLTAAYYAEVLMTSKQFKFSTYRKLSDLSKLRQVLLKKYQEIEVLGKEKEIKEEELKENIEEFFAEDYTEIFNPIYANTIDNTEAETLFMPHENGGGSNISIMSCLFFMIENKLIKE